MRGYAAIGMYEPKTEENLGGLFRSAHAFGASYLFVIGARYRRECTDTTNATAHMPLFTFDTFDAFRQQMPVDAKLVAVEKLASGLPLETFVHPQRAVYLLGGEDRTLPPEVLRHCSTALIIDTQFCLNVATAGSIVLYDRHAKGLLRRSKRSAWSAAEISA